MPLRETTERIKKEASLVMSPKDEARLKLGADLCPVCGKAFFSTPEWGYRRVAILGRQRLMLPVCSWTCFRAERGLVPICEKRW